MFCGHLNENALVYGQYLNTVHIANFLDIAWKRLVFWLYLRRFKL